MSQNKIFIYECSLQDIFKPSLEGALEDMNFEVSDESRLYILDVIESRLHKKQKSSDKSMLSEALLRAIQLEEKSQKKKELKNLGEFILFQAGFFGASLKRKIVGVSYYVQMGQATYQSLYSTSPHPVYLDFSKRFSSYVDLLALMGSKMVLSETKDIFTLFERYQDLGSKSAYQELVKMGLLPAGDKKASNQ